MTFALKVLDFVHFFTPAPLFFCMSMDQDRGGRPAGAATVVRLFLRRMVEEIRQTAGARETMLQNMPVANSTRKGKAGPASRMERRRGRCEAAEVLGSECLTVRAFGLTVRAFARKFEQCERLREYRQPRQAPAGGPQRIHGRTQKIYSLSKVQL